MKTKAKHSAVVVRLRTLTAVNSQLRCIGTDMLDFSLQLPRGGLVIELFFRDAGRERGQVRARPQRVGALDAESAGQPVGKRQNSNQVRAIAISRDAGGAKLIAKCKAKADDRERARAPKRSYEALL